jgi:7-cyano-7-deazaguanine synthase
MANLATKLGVEGNKININAPLINMSKAEIVTKGLELGVDYSETHSCYDPVIKDGETFACGHCDSCKLRMDGFTAANKKDPISYV